ncbi:MAG: hypothetical protein AB1295_05870 [Candidatus Micrarchaeota archaeon]
MNDLKTMIENDLFWKVDGEAISYEGRLDLFVAKQGKNLRTPKKSFPPAHILKNKDLLKEYPESCQHRGFNKFYGVRAEMFSLGHSLTYFCPKCRKDIKELEDN